MIRSAKMNAITPPKLIPPFQSTAASGTFPIEHTNDAIETMGPTSGPQSFASTGWWTRKNPCQNEFGTHAARAPAMRSPITTSRMMAAHSITNECEIAVKPRVEVTRDQIEPPETDMSIAA